MDSVEKACEAFPGLWFRKRGKRPSNLTNRAPSHAFSPMQPSMFIEKAILHVMLRDTKGGGIVAASFSRCLFSYFRFSNISKTALFPVRVQHLQIIHLLPHLHPFLWPSDTRLPYPVTFCNSPTRLPPTKNSSFPQSIITPPTSPYCAVSIRRISLDYERSLSSSSVTSSVFRPSLFRQATRYKQCYNTLVTEKNHV